MLQSLADTKTTFRGFFLSTNRCVGCPGAYRRRVLVFLALQHAYLNPLNCLAMTNSQAFTVDQASEESKIHAIVIAQSTSKCAAVAMFVFLCYAIALLRRLVQENSFSTKV